jgi:opacity protein-like surface antigen
MVKHRTVRHGLSLLALAGALAGAGASSAADDDFTRRGAYVGVGGSYVSDVFEGEIEDALGVPVDVDPSGGVNAHVGYRLASFAALEAEYEWVDEFDIAVAGLDAASLEAHALTGNLKLIVPTWRIQPYLLLGLGAVRFELDEKLGLGLSEKDWALAGRAGVGVDVHLTRHLSLDVGASAVLTDEEVKVGASEINAIHFLSATAGLRFTF